MASTLKEFLFSKGMPGETVGDLAARLGIGFEELANANTFSSSSDQVAGKWVAVPWDSFAGDVQTTPLGKLVLEHEVEVLKWLERALKPTAAPVRISNVPFQWDFSALSTIVSFSVSRDAAVLTASEGVGVLERLLPGEKPEAAALERLIDRLCASFSEALSNHRRGR